MNIFVDGSYSPQKKVGVGGYMIIDNQTMLELSELTISELKDVMNSMITYSIFNESKGSTDVEQQILDLALHNVNTTLNISVYTDCQKTQPTDNYDVIHVKGHAKQDDRIVYEKIFDVIDKKVRKHLRQWLKDNEPTKDLLVQYEVMVESRDVFDELEYSLETLELPCEYDVDLYRHIHTYFDNSPLGDNLIEVRSIKIIKK